MNNIKFKKKYHTSCFQDVDLTMKKTIGTWAMDNAFIGEGLRETIVECNSWLELKENITQLKEQLIEIGDVVNTPFGEGVVENILNVFYPSYKVVQYDKDGNVLRYIICTDRDIELVNKKESKINKEKDIEIMENKELNEIRELAMDIINKVKYSKLNQVSVKRNVEVTEFEKKTEVRALVDKHVNALKEEIGHLMGRENDETDIEPSFNIYSYLTTEEVVERGKIFEKASNDYQKTEKQFDNIINSLHLCTTVDQVNNFLEKQGFVKQGLIVEPEKWEGNEEKDK